MKHDQEEKKNEPTKAPLWLLTFTDIMALMLTFFVLLYSMAVPEEEKWDEFSSALTTGFSKFKSAPKFAGSQQEINIDRIDMKKALSLDYLESLINDIIGNNKSLSNVRVINQGDRLILSLPVDLMFDTGSALVGEQGKRALYNIGGPLSRIRNRIEVIGHTDPTPVDSQARGYDSNWELSLARAASVSGILHDVGYDRPFLIRGMSSARYDELPSSFNVSQRLDYARRVDIIILKDDGQTRLLIR